ncbi:DUF5995 family protein [Streptomyces sp. NPDC005921]|uniref:DUF5995 family protein n=1 Tax=Streptomyces sp. NPDC005827 TaxID=3157070 RepID=UPI0033ED451E
MTAQNIDDVVDRPAGIAGEAGRTGGRAGRFAALHRQVTVEIRMAVRGGLFGDGLRTYRSGTLFGNRYFDAFAAAAARNGSWRRGGRRPRAHEAGRPSAQSSRPAAADRQTPESRPPGCPPVPAHPGTGTADSQAATAHSPSTAGSDGSEPSSGKKASAIRPVRRRSAEAVSSRVRMRGR